MGYFFSPYEIAEMAMRVEAAGAAFYQKAAKFAPEGKVREIFLFLSNEEIDHQNTFRIIRDMEQKKNTAVEYAIDLAAHIERLIEEYKQGVFDLNPEEISALTVAKCLDIGIRTERGLLTVYTELYETFVDKFHSVLTSIANQEKDHLEALQNVKKELGL